MSPAKASDPAVAAQVRQACRELHLPSVSTRAATVAEDAARGGASHLAFLAAVLEIECEDRAERRRARLVAEAKFPRLKRLEDFSFDQAPVIPVALIRELATGAFIDRAEHVIFLGESGTGKSHLAIALGISACMASRKVRFTTTAALVNELLEARDDKTLSRVVARYAKVELLILDELAYVPLSATEAELLFQVLDERSERGSIVLTTNLPFGEWTKVFPEPRLCKAVVDRLTFNAHIVETGSDSWRFRSSMERRKGGRKTA
jgi:DNA replication protein DnaC